MVRISRPGVGVVMAAMFAAGMSACSSADQASPTPRTKTVMVTVMASVPSAASTSATSSSEPVAPTDNSPSSTTAPAVTTTTQTPSSTPVPTSPTGTTPTPGGGFDAAWAKQAVGMILGDIKAIDGLSQDDSSIGQDYSNLSDAYGYLEQAGLPKGADGDAYLGGLETLLGLAADASAAVATDAAAAHAKYLSARQQTQPILDDVNSDLGTHYVVPAAPTAATATGG